MPVVEHPKSALETPLASRVRRLLAALGALVAVAGVAADASATPEYPLVLNAVYGTDCPQLSRCLICHLTARGGQATAVRPFAETLRMYGLNRGRDSNALMAALAQLPEDTDSDDDGVPDIDELMTCGNPSGSDLGGGPTYGCDGAHLAPAAPASERHDAPLGLVALLASILLVRRRPAR